MDSLYAQNSDFLFMIEQAIKAPSGHNTQPWLFKVNEQSIEIYPNYDKALSVVDSDNRELFISLGCATENLCIAASEKGYRSNVAIDNQGVISVALMKEESVKPDPLYAHIAVRQTNRSVYNGNIIPVETINLLKEISSEAGISMYYYKNGTSEYDSISGFVLKGNSVQMQDKAFVEELHSWMRYNKKHQDKYNDGLSYAVFGAPNLPMFVVKPIMKKAVNEKSQNKGDKKKIESSSHFVLFTTRSNHVEEWINLGRTLERFLLRSTELGIVHAYLNQPNEIRELTGEMAESLCLYNEYPTILLRIGYGDKMPYSKRKNIEVVIM